MPKYIGKSEDTELLKELEIVGLKEKEAATYFALLRLGEVGTSHISEATGLHTQFIYIALESLEEKGLVQHVIRRGRKKFSAKHPQSLVRLVNDRKRLVDSLADKLEQIAELPKEQRFEVFQGNESYVAHEFDLLKEAAFGSEILIIEGKGNRFSEEMGTRLGEYEQLRLKKKIAVRFIGSSDSKEELDAYAGRELFSYHLLPGLFTGQVGTDIWEHAVAFNVYSEPVTSSVHYNTQIAESHRQFFETLWNLSKE